MTAYYNEIDPFCAQWLRNLIAAGHIAPGDVDERDVRDIRPDDLAGYRQHHFFAGIGVWSHSLRRAGWPDDRPVWTGSCPCQPFSQAGKGAGFADERHLWPAWFHLIRERRPSVVFGEQVAGKNGLAWFDLVQTGMEGLAYACGSVPFPAAGVGAPHIRERLYWMAYANVEDQGGWRIQRPGKSAASSFRPERERSTGLCTTSGMGHGESERRERRTHDGNEGRRERTFGQASALDGMGDAGRAGAGRNAGTISEAEREASLRAERDGAVPASADDRPGSVNGFWRAADWLLCTDGKWRPVEPGTFPLVDGTPARVGRLRAYGNAIVAPQAQAFIEAAMEVAP